MFKKTKFKQTRFACSIKFMEYYLPYLEEIAQNNDGIGFYWAECSPYYWL